MFLSQPGMATLASYHCPLMTVSIESAMMSRDCSEKDMPSVPMEMPSLTPVLFIQFLAWAGKGTRSR